MQRPRLTVTVRDPMSELTTVRSFLTSPALIGRGHLNALRLYAKSVSRYHGALLFREGTVAFIDFGSRNGSKVDGHRARPEVPVPVTESGIIEVGPFSLTVAVDTIAVESLDEMEVTKVMGPRRVSRKGPSGARLLTLVPPGPPH